MTRSPKAAGQGRKLSNSQCFAVHSANLAFGRAYKPILDAAGLIYTQSIAMVALSEQDEQTVSVLGEKLFQRGRAPVGSRTSRSSSTQ